MRTGDLYQHFGLQVSPDGKRFLGWTIIKLGDGSWDLKKPGDDVPKDIDLGTPPQYFREAEEALGAFKAVPGGGRKYNGEWRGYHRYEPNLNELRELLKNEEFLQDPALQEWMIQILKFFIKKRNRPASMREIRISGQVTDNKPIVASTFSQLNKVIGKFGIRILVAGPHDFHKQDWPLVPYQLFWVGDQILNQGKDKE